MMAAAASHLSAPACCLAWHVVPVQLQLYGVRLYGMQHAGAGMAQHSCMAAACRRRIL
eukprot:COSAG01_NODE_49805_length_369_cov_0.459259_1_plen_57_part_10